MKKFRMMLPALAVIFAVGGAIAGDFFSPVNAYYKVTTTSCSSSPQVTEQSDCQLSNDTSRPICTILVGSNHKQAFQNNDCSGVLRNIPQ